jgi:hypothetical protein
VAAVPQSIRRPYSCWSEIGNVPVCCGRTVARNLRQAAEAVTVIHEEVARLGAWGERHRRLLARLLIAFTLSLGVDLLGALGVWLVERGAKGTDIHTYGQAVFFSTVQVLTVSSSLKNPLTVAGRVLDVVLELWAVFVITAVAGSFASFFHSGDASG